MLEKKGIGKAKAGLIVCTVLVVMLAISNVWFYIRVDSLQSQVNTLQSDISNLETDKSSLEAQVDDLQTQIDSLEEPQLHQVNIEWSDNHPWFASPYISISGTIFNSGTYSASNVILTVRIYDSAGTLLESEEILFGTIDGKSYKGFDTTITYSGDADYVTTTLSYD